MYGQGLHAGPKRESWGPLKKLTRILEEILDKPVPNDRLKRTYAEKLVEAMVQRAIDKSDTLAKEILDRTDGKPLQSLQVEGTLDAVSNMTLSEVNARIIDLLGKSPELIEEARTRAATLPNRP